MSATLHGLLLILLALIIPRPAGQAGAEPLRRAAIALVQQTEGTVEYLSDKPQTSSSGETTVTAEPTALTTADALPTPDDLAIDLAGALPSVDELAVSGLGNGAAGLFPGADQMTSGAGPSKKIGNSTHTYVFGIEGEGSVFLYVFDRSDSMNGYGGRPLAAAKAELINSLRGLEAVHQFQIIFYNNEVSAFNPFAPQPPRLMFADDKSKAMAEDFVRQISGAGGTRHMPPLRLALRLSPDVVFFLTDAAQPRLSEEDLRDLRRANSGTVIHTIEFGAGPIPGGDNFLKKLARQNNGQYAYVDVTALPKR